MGDPDQIILQLRQPMGAGGAAAVSEKPFLGFGAPMFRCSPEPIQDSCSDRLARRAAGVGGSDRVKFRAERLGVDERRLGADEGALSGVATGADPIPLRPNVPFRAGVW